MKTLLTLLTQWHTCFCIYCQEKARVPAVLKMRGFSQIMLEVSLMLLSADLFCIYFDNRKYQNTRSRHLSPESFKRSVKNIVKLARTVSSHFYCTCPQQLLVSTRHLPQSNSGLTRRDAPHKSSRVLTCTCRRRSRSGAWHSV